MKKFQIKKPATQIYAEVDEEKLEEDMAGVEDRLRERRLKKSE